MFKTVHVQQKVNKLILLTVTVLLCFLIFSKFQPRNIFLHEPELRVKIGDFGLAKDDLVKESDDILLTPSPVDLYGKLCDI